MSTQEEYNILFRPFEGAQQDFLSNDADEVLFASCVGAGKSLCLLVDAAKYVEKYPTFNALLLRRTYPELEASLIKESQKLYTGQLGGTYNKTQHLWTFRNGARIQFGSLDDDNRITNYRGIDWTYLGFDELTTFKWEHYQTLSIWLRSSKEVPLRVRATSNAGGLSHQEVFDYWKNWLNPEHKYHLKSNQIAKIGGKTRSCIMAYMGDNPSINPETYKKQFVGKPKHIVQQLLNNDWRAVPGLAEYFKREHIEIITDSGRIVKRCRSYDLAGSESKTADYTASILLGIDYSGKVVVEDVYRARLSTDKVERLIMDNAIRDGREVKIVLPLEPAAAGKAWADKLSKILHGYHFVFIPQNRATGGKITRAKPISAQSLQGNMKVVNNDYTTVFLDELEAFTDDDKLYSNDDMVDALSQGYNELSKSRAVFADVGDWGPLRTF